MENQAANIEEEEYKPTVSWEDPTSYPTKEEA